MALSKSQKAFCVLNFAVHRSVVTVQRNFRRPFQRDPPSGNYIEIEREGEREIAIEREKERASHM